MLVDLLSVWAQQLSTLIVAIFEYIFPEYPKVGFGVMGATLIFFAYYALKGRFDFALKMAGSTFVTLIFLLYVVHILVKLFHIAL